MDLRQYNVLPNITVLMFPDLLNVIRARPGATPDGTPRTKPNDLTMSPEQKIFGLVINEDVTNLQYAQRGLHQPGFTHLAISGEECRIINLHRNLERYTGVQEMSGGAPLDDPM